MTKLFVLVLTLAATLVSGGNYGRGGRGGGGGGYMAVGHQGFKGMGRYPSGNYLKGMGQTGSYYYGDSQFGQKGVSTYPGYPPNGGGSYGGHQHGPYCYGYQMNRGHGHNYYAADQFRGSSPGGQYAVQGFENQYYYPTGDQFMGSYPGPGNNFQSSSMGQYVYQQEYPGSFQSSFAGQNAFPAEFPNSGPMTSQASGQAVSSGNVMPISPPSVSSDSFMSIPAGQMNDANMGSMSSMSSGQMTSGSFNSMPFQNAGKSGIVWTSEEIMGNRGNAFMTADSKFLSAGSPAMPPSYSSI